MYSTPNPNYSLPNQANATKPLRAIRAEVAGKKPASAWAYIKHHYPILAGLPGMRDRILTPTPKKKCTT